MASVIDHEFGGILLRDLDDREEYVMKQLFARQTVDGPLYKADQCLEEPNLLNYEGNENKIDYLFEAHIKKGWSLARTVFHYPYMRNDALQIVDRRLYKERCATELVPKILAALNQHNENRRRVVNVNLVGNKSDGIVLRTLEEGLNSEGVYRPYVDENEIVKKRSFWRRQKPVKVCREKLEKGDPEIVKQHLTNSLNDGTPFLIYYSKRLVSAIGSNAKFTNRYNVRWILRHLELNSRSKNHTAILFIVKDKRGMALPDWMRKLAGENVWTFDQIEKPPD